MTEKDYILIELVIDSSRTSESGMSYGDAISDITRRFALSLKLDNPKFNSSRFFVACGLSGEPFCSDLKPCVFCRKGEGRRADHEAS